MSEWTYIAIAYGLTWLTFAVYALMLRARRSRLAAAAAELPDTATGSAARASTPSSHASATHGRSQP